MVHFLALSVCTSSHYKTCLFISLTIVFSGIIGFIYYDIFRQFFTRHSMASDLWIFSLWFGAGGEDFWVQKVSITHAAYCITCRVYKAYETSGQFVYWFYTEALFHSKQCHCKMQRNIHVALLWTSYTPIVKFKNISGIHPITQL